MKRRFGLLKKQSGRGKLKVFEPTGSTFTGRIPSQAAKKQQQGV